MEPISYTPPLTVDRFITDYIPGKLFYDFIIGPVGSGKTTGDFMKLVYMSKLQARGADGVRRSRCVVVRNTAPQLKDTTIKSWLDWFPPNVAGHWHATEKTFDLKFDDVECEVLFRPLDTEEDVARVLSLEVTFAIIDEFIDVPRAIIEALSGRCGRYPSKRHGGATNYGMWGASNPGTEDNWWFDFLHNASEVERIELFGATRESTLERLRSVPSGDRNIRYFHQPGGMTQYAENLENLPPYERGNHQYYIDRMKNKSPAWIKQFIDAEWGFSASDTPVVKTFNSDIHVAKKKPRFMPQVMLIGGMDPGLGGMAVIFGQEDLYGRLWVIGEVGAVGFGASRFINEKLKPYMRFYFPNADFVMAPDPAASNRVQTNESTVVDELRKHFIVKSETNNRLAPRLQAIEHYTTRNTEMGAALQIDREMCPNLCRALAGGWRFEKVKRSGSDDSQFKVAPEKNSWSHWGDAFGYLCQYYYRQYEKNARYGRSNIGHNGGPPLQTNIARPGGVGVPMIRQRRNIVHLR